MRADEYVGYAESLREGRELESIGAVLIAIHHDLQAIVARLDTLYEGCPPCPHDDAIDAVRGES